MTEQEFLVEVGRRIKIAEGCVLYAYDDANDRRVEPGDDVEGTLTIGYGHTGADVHPGMTITQQQADAIFAHELPKYVAEARGTLAAGIFDALDDVRRFVIIDLTYNMGPGVEGWGGFTGTHALIAAAVAKKKAGRIVEAHALFGEAAQHLEASAWYGQTGIRAKRDVAMMRTGEWARADGDGSDV